MGLIILQILKWALLFLLVLLVLIFTILLMILFVPVCYVAKGEKQEKKMWAEGYFAWFSGLVKLDLSYKEKLEAKLRVAGFTIYDKDKKVEQSESIHEKKGFFIQRKMKNKIENKADKENSTYKEDLNDSFDSTSSQYIKEKAAARKSSTASGTDTEESYGSEERLVSEEGIVSEKGNESEERHESEQKESRKPQNSRNFLSFLFGKIKKLKEKAESYYKLFEREETQITLKRTAKKLFRILKYLLPDKGKIEGKVGFDDPSKTGELMAFVSLLYPFWGKYIEIVPYYEDEVMEFSFDCRGKVFIGLLLYQIISLILNKHFIRFIKLVKKQGL